MCLLLQSPCNGHINKCMMMVSGGTIDAVAKYIHGLLFGHR